MSKNKKPAKVTKETNLKQSLLKLFNYIKRYLPLIIPALILAIISSIFSIIGPDKLSDITDEITKGLITGINLDKVKEIGIFLILLIVIYSKLKTLKRILQQECIMTI